MKKTDFGVLPCPIARSLGRVGEWWSILILRDAFYGLSRFDEFEKSLNIAPNMLSRRLNDLVASGLLEKYLYCDKPPRHAYRLTEAGRDFRPVLWALLEWGNKHFSPEGKASVLVNRETGQAAEPIVVDRVTGQPITEQNYTVAAGPAATAGMRYRLEFRELRRTNQDVKFDPPAGINDWGTA